MAAMKPLADMLERSGFELLDELLKVTEKRKKAKPIVVERVELIRKAGIAV